jgi:hypothetical protein
VGERTPGEDGRLFLRNNRPKFKNLRTQPVIMEVCFRCVRTIAKSHLIVLSRLSVCLFVHLSVWNNSAPTRWIFMKLYLMILLKYVDRIQFTLKSDKTSGYFITRATYIYDNISPNSCFQKNFVEKIKTQFMLNFFSPENCTVYNVKWKRVLARQATDYNITRRKKKIRYACFVTKTRVQTQAYHV